MRIEKILRCNHTHGVPGNRNMTKEQKQSSELDQLQSMERRSPFKTQSPQFEFNIVCKNLCAEIKFFISSQFSEVLLNEKPQFNSIFSSLNYTDATNPVIQQRNLLCLRILKCLLIANPKIMEAFEKLNGSALWMGVILKLYESSGHNNKVLSEMFSFLFDILLNRNNAFELLQCYSTRNLEEIPLICTDRIQYLQVIQDILLKCEFDDEIANVMDVISGLCNQSDNKRLFRENGGVTFLFQIMLNLKNTTNNFYTQILTVFEQLISQFQVEDVDLFFEKFFHTEFFKKCAKENLENLFIDLLSFLSIHVALQTNQNILDRIITQEYYYVLF